MHNCRHLNVHYFVKLICAFLRNISGSIRMRKQIKRSPTKKSECKAKLLNHPKCIPQFVFAVFPHFVFALRLFLDEFDLDKLCVRSPST